MLTAATQMTKKHAPDPGHAAMNVRMPVGLLRELDEWLASENDKRAWPKMTRSDLVRIVLERAVKDRPDLGK